MYKKYKKKKPQGEEVVVKHYCGHLQKHYLKEYNLETIEFLSTKLCKNCLKEELLNNGARTITIPYKEYKEIFEEYFVKTVPNSYNKKDKTIDIFITEEEENRIIDIYVCNKNLEEENYD